MRGLEERVVNFSLIQFKVSSQTFHPTYNHLKKMDGKKKEDGWKKKDGWKEDGWKEERRQMERRKKMDGIKEED